VKTRLGRPPGETASIAPTMHTIAPARVKPDASIDARDGDATGLGVEGDAETFGV
jgi:hypothetical protein